MAGNYRGSENTHWYASQQTVDMGAAPYVGAPVEFVPGKNGDMVRATVREARKFALRQGATAVMGMLAKPALYDWASKMTALGAVEKDEAGSCLAALYVTNEINKDEYLDRCLIARDSIGKEAAAGGTTLHKYMELGVQGEPLDEEGQKVWDTIRGELETHWPGLTWKAELPAVHDLGFGCRTDLLGFDQVGTPVACVDLKTRVFTSGDVLQATSAVSKGYKSLGRLTPRETEPMQVAANLMAHNPSAVFYDGCGGNIYLSRSEAACVFTKTYTAKQMKDAWACFRALNEVFLILKGLK